MLKYTATLLVEFVFLSVCFCLLLMVLQYMSNAFVKLPQLKQLKTSSPMFCSFDVTESSVEKNKALVTTEQDCWVG